MTTLLNIDANAKTVKGQKLGFMTAILYLLPWKHGGVNLCPMAEIAGCAASCLNTAGRGGIAKRGAIIATDGGSIPDNTIQRARQARTKLFNENRNLFLSKLLTELDAFIAQAKRKGLVPVVRLNGTSDIQWERVRINKTTPNIFALYPDLQFYDYTKIAKRFNRKLPDNYHLTLSYSEASKRYAASCLKARADHNVSMVVVVRNLEAKARYSMEAEITGANVVDGDAHDLRFLDPANSVVVLKAKGSASKDTSGFVID
ncbi:hypothetical protein LCGC14_1031670 [marine sediment metagenome]|uniref:Gene product 88 domain-containing protein n=1 Tax=marine sediment metagenome TaxID=412755 RepID=A0A0F9R0E3_9ZZZZ